MSRAYCKRVLHRLGPMVEAELDARGQNSGNGFAHLRRKFFVNDVAAERQRQAVVFLAPPDAEVFANHQPFVLIRQLAFVNDEADVRLASADGLKIWSNGTTT